MGKNLQQIHNDGQADGAKGEYDAPHDTIDQAGLDVQATLGSTLLKFEGIARDGHRGEGAKSFGAIVAGVEHIIKLVDVAKVVDPILILLAHHAGIDDLKIARQARRRETLRRCHRQ